MDAAISGRLATLARSLRFDVLVGSLIGASTWPLATVSHTAPISPIDVSWIVGLHLAARQGLHFGEGVLFTYGPLGFLGYPQPYVAWTSGLALAFVGVIHLTACVTSFHLARATLGGPRAFVLVTATAFTFVWATGWTMYGVLVFVACAVALRRRREHPTGSLFALAFGIAIGFAGLGKLNIAMISALIALIGVAATARDPRRAVLIYSATMIVSFFVLWIATGQQLRDVATYARGAIEISTGYSESMGQVDPQTPAVAGVTALTTLILGALAWQASAELPARDRYILRILLTVMMFAAYKAGFVRAGLGMTMYLVVLLALWPSVVPRFNGWPQTSLTVAGLLAAFLALLMVPVTAIVDPIARVSALTTEAATVIGGRTGAASSTEADLRRVYDLPPEAIALLSGRTAEMLPWDTAAAYAYPETTWRPEPVFQPYSAYTSYLDRQNASLLEGTRAPERILWATPVGAPLSIDGRSVWFDAPMAKLEMVCRYLPLAAAPTWQVLGRVPSRCGTPVVVGIVNTAAGAPISVPRALPPGILTVRVSGMASDLVSKGVNLAYKMPPWWVKLGATKYRIPVGTADDPAVIAATTDVGYVQALAIGPAPDTLVIGPDAGAPGDGSPLTVTFEVVPVASLP